MTNNRQKGKRGELKAVHLLSDIFPDCHRNWLSQTAKRRNGCDLAGTVPFNFEVKHGKIANIKKVRGWLNQVEEEGRRINWDVVLSLPDREKPWVLMPFSDFKEILWLLKKEGLI